MEMIKMVNQSKKWTDQVHRKHESRLTDRLTKLMTTVDEAARKQRSE